jgi:hypothetical protein
MHAWLATRTRTAAVVLALAVLPGGAPPGGKGPPQPLPDDLVAAWTKAGATAGWLRIDRDGYLIFISGKKGNPGDLPAFRIDDWQNSVLPRLPAPQAPFGLNLSFTRITDAGLKELAGFKQLQALDLGETKITGAGLKELASLKQLQVLDLGFAKVTDAGLKGLAGLKQLQTLVLGDTKITDAGLKELAGLKE